MLCYVLDLEKPEKAVEYMSRKCDICGKHTVTGNNVSHAHNKTRRVWKPNILTIQAKVGGSTRKLKVCTSCLRSGRVVKA